METNKGVMATALGFLAAHGMESGILRPASAKQPKAFTEFDQMRIDKAAAKRARKAAKLRLELSTTDTLNKE